MQEEDFLLEFIDVVKTKEQEVFAEKWFKTRYLRHRTLTMDMWMTLAR